MALLWLTLILDPRLAGWLTREDHVVEWLQAGLCAGAALLALRSARDVWRAGDSPVVEVLIAAMLAGLVIGELDLDRRVLGTKIISSRFLADGSVWLGWRAAAALPLVGAPAALAAYALWRRRELLRGIGRVLTEPWGRVLLCGVAIFGLTEVLEKPLGTVPGLPRYFLEEMLELVAAICFAVALWARGPGRAVRAP